MELAHALRIDPRAARPPYSVVSPERLQRAAACLAALPRPILGLCWRGGAWNPHRSLDLQPLLASVRATAGSLVSLQADAAEAERAAARFAGDGVCPASDRRYGRSHRQRRSCRLGRHHDRPSRRRARASDILAAVPRRRLALAGKRSVLSVVPCHEPAPPNRRGRLDASAARTRRRFVRASQPGGGWLTSSTRASSALSATTLRDPGTISIRRISSIEMPSTRQRTILITSAWLTITMCRPGNRCRHRASAAAARVCTAAIVSPPGGAAERTAPVELRPGRLRVQLLKAEPAPASEIDLVHVVVDLHRQTETGGDRPGGFTRALERAGKRPPRSAVGRASRLGIRPARSPSRSANDLACDPPARGPTNRNRRAGRDGTSFQALARVTTGSPRRG